MSLNENIKAKGTNRFHFLPIYKKKKNKKKKKIKKNKNKNKIK